MPSALTKLFTPPLPGTMILRPEFGTAKVPTLAGELEVPLVYLDALSNPGTILIQVLDTDKLQLIPHPEYVLAENGNIMSGETVVFEPKPVIAVADFEVLPETTARPAVDEGGAKPKVTTRVDLNRDRNY